MATFIIDWPSLALIGFVFGAFSERARWWESRAFRAGAISAATFTLVAMVSYLIVPDWMWMYFIEPDGAAWAAWLMPLAYMFAFTICFAAAVSLAELGRSALWSAVAIAGALQIAVIALTWERYHLVGTATEWTAGRADELFSLSPTGDARTIGLIVPIFVVVAGIALYRTVRGRRASASDR